MAWTTGQQEAKARRELLFRIVGEVDPSAKKSLTELQHFLNLTAKTTKDAGEAFEDVSGRLEAITKIRYGEGWEEFNKVLGESQSALEALLKVGEEHIVARDEEAKKAKEAAEVKKKAAQETAEAEKKAAQEAAEAEKVQASLWSKTTRAINTAGNALIAFGAGFIGVNLILGKIQKRFQAVRDAILDIARSGVQAFKDLVKSSLEVNSSFEQIELRLRAILGSEEAAAAYMKVFRDIAAQAGRTVMDVGEASTLMIPFTGGSPERMEEMLNLSIRLQTLRPELGLRTAGRAITQFLSGYSYSLTRSFGITSAVVKSVEEAGYSGVAALEEIFKRMGLGQELISEYAKSWQGLAATIKDFGQRTLRNITLPVFESLKEVLSGVTAWLSENAGQIRTFSLQLGEGMGKGVRDLLDVLFGAEGLSEEKLFEVAKWGANLVGSLAHGILEGIQTYLIPAVVSITQTLASFLRGMSPPETGILATIDQWFGPIIRAYLSGFDASDFQALVDVTSIIKATLQTSMALGEISQAEYNSALVNTRSILVTLVEDMRKFGTVSASVWQSLQGYIGIDVQLIQGYVDLVGRLEAANAALEASQQRLRAVQEAYNDALEKVRKVQEEITMFELETAEIPERYKRGARKELEYKLLAAQKEARFRQEAVTAAQEQVAIARQQVTVAKQMLSNYKQMITALQQLAREAAEAAKEEEDLVDVAGDFKDIVEETLEGPFLQLWEDLHEALVPVKEDLREIMDFFRGLLGLPTVEQMPGGPVSLIEYEEAYDLGARMRDAIGTIVENLPKIGEGFRSITDGLQSIVAWYDGQPEWVQNLIKSIGKVVAISIALNWITGGISTGLASILAGIGLKLAAFGFKTATALGVPGAVAAYGFPVAIVFATVLGLLAIMEGVAQTAQDFGIEIIGPGDWVRGIQLRLEEGDTFIEAIQGTFDEVAVRLATWLTDVIGPIWQNEPVMAALIGFALGGIPGAIALAQQADYTLPEHPGMFVGDWGTEGEETADTWLQGFWKSITDSEVSLGDLFKPPEGLNEQAMETAGTWIQGIWDTISGADKELGEAATTGILDPLVAIGKEIWDFLVGESLFPDLMKVIIKLFENMVEDLRQVLQNMVTTIKTYGDVAAQWWDHYMVSMSNSLQGFVNNLYTAIYAIQYYLATVAQMNIFDPTTTGEAPPGKPGTFQMGGLIPKTGIIFAHAQEIILNAAQQRNVAGAIAGGMMPDTKGFGAGAIVVNQKNWKFSGALTDAERKKLKDMAMAGAYEGIASVFSEA